MRRAVTVTVAGLAGIFVVLAAIGGDLRAQTTATSQALLSFDADIRPIVSRNCWSCHGADQRSELDLRTRTGMLAGGRLGQAV
ncbi:MAG: hypothetical protein CL489_12155, partial [Acidobacteria bacterium]|nr:hypothetical protein [Acidobacteriota bacterium]